MCKTIRHNLCNSKEILCTEHFFSHLGVGQLRELAGAKLEGYSNAELAERFGRSERTIERRLHLIREKCQQEMIEFHEHPPQTTTD